MSRAFHPPDTLSKEDIRTIATVRRDIWVNSGKGLIIGSVGGYFIHTVARITYHRYKSIQSKLPSSTSNNHNNNTYPTKIKFTRNTRLLSIMLGGAIGSFIMSITTGKNEIHHLYPIFQIGARKWIWGDDDANDETISTHLTLQELSILQNDQQQQHTTNNVNDSASIDRTQLERNRLYRRMTLSNKMQHQYSSSYGKQQDPQQNANGSSMSPSLPGTATDVPNGIIVEEDGRLLSDQEAIVKISKKYP